MSISINTHKRLNWTLEDKHGKIVLEPTQIPSREIDGLNIGVDDRMDKISIWISLSEAQSLRDWLNTTLP